MKLRDFITLLGGAAAAMPFAAFAQQLGRVRRMPNVGILNYAAADDALVNEFRRALRGTRPHRGTVATITYRWADGRFERLPNLAAELVASKVDVIIALGPATWAAKEATTPFPSSSHSVETRWKRGGVKPRTARRKHHRLLLYVDRSGLQTPRATKQDVFKERTYREFSTIQMNPQRCWKCERQTLLLARSG